MRYTLLSFLLLSLFVPAHLAPADAPVQRSSKEALQAFNDLIGSWNGIGEPEGTRQEKQHGSQGRPAEHRALPEATIKYRWRHVTVARTDPQEVGIVLAGGTRLQEQEEERIGLRGEPRLEEEGIVLREAPRLEEGTAL